MMNPSQSHNKFRVTKGNVLWLFCGLFYTQTAPPHCLSIGYPTSQARHDITSAWENYLCKVD